MTETINQYQKGVKYLCETGVDKVPSKYVLPLQERPTKSAFHATQKSLKLPVIDFAELLGKNRPQVLKSLATACKEFGFFQLVNHGIPIEIINGMIDVGSRFFDLPFDERSKYMSSDMRAPVRYGTSYNQNKDKVFCWRDFLKLLCNPLPEFLPHWPSAPLDLRKLGGAYAKETQSLFVKLMEALLESLLGSDLNTRNEEINEQIMKKFEDGSQLMAINCYPQCPEPDLTLGMPPHSDYGFLTLLLQDQVEGLQICHSDKWVTVEPIANSFVVNVGDHLEIFSNGRYKSVLHRVLVNSKKSRISVASLHSMPFTCMVKPWRELVDDETNPRRYKDTDFASFLEYISSCEPKNKSFLESRKINII